ncbi:ATP-binding protein [Pedobacter westerhofensis]|nr:ATP-binding protein [Pedobacter westerhofensis]
MVNKLIRKLRESFFLLGSTSIQTAKLKLFYLMLGANVLKGLLYLGDAIVRYHGMGSFRALRLIVTSIIMIMLLKRFPKLLYWGIHYAIIGTILHLYYRVFNQHVGADIISIQCIYMVIISAFYGLNKFWGVIYTLIAAAAVILYHYIGFRMDGLHPLPMVTNDLYICINFMVILLSHIYFHGVLYGNLREMESLNEQLRISNEHRTNFLSTMSHELRTPLNSVIGISGLLIHNNSDPRQKQELDMLKFSAEGLLTLINDILDINKFDSGKLELEVIPFNLSALLNNISESVARQHTAKKLAVVIEIDEALKEVSFLGDPTRLGQIMYNLLGNAMKFTNEGQITVSAELLGQTPEYDKIRIQVSDTGIGISESQLENIFEPFRQASNSTTRKFGGTGLGLSIVKKLVEAFGGQIQVKSVQGQGTSFSFEIAMKQTTANVLQNRSGEPQEEKKLTEIRILLAEDNMMNIYFMQQVFKRWEISADVAENGTEVLELLAKNHYDVILMDMHMPVMDGIEATREIRQLEDQSKANVYIIALTATVSDDIQIKVREYGMNDYLPKPFQLDELRNLLLMRSQDA